MHRPYTGRVPDGLSASVRVCVVVVQANVCNKMEHVNISFYVHPRNIANNMLGVLLHKNVITLRNNCTLMEISPDARAQSGK